MEGVHIGVHHSGISPPFLPAGVRNIEMESTEFAAFCNRAGIPGAIVCVTLLNRLKGDQVESSPEQLAQYSDNAQAVVINYIRKQLGR